mgnify:CR=1 FL=1
MSMREDQILGMCESLAWRFNSPSHVDDMIQEGVLKCYELINEDADVHPAKLFREAKRRMHDYLNIDVLPVAMPKSRTIRDIVRTGGTDHHSNYGEENIGWIKSILAADRTPYEEHFSSSKRDHVQEYENKDYQNYLFKVAGDVLTTQEMEVMRMRYVYGMSQDDVGLRLKQNKMWGSRREDSALNKMRKSIL